MAIEPKEQMIRVKILRDYWNDKGERIVAGTELDLSATRAVWEVFEGRVAPVKIEQKG